MRLTISDRSAFVRAVMDDVPKVDYEELYRKKLQQWCIDNLPDDLRPLYAKYPDHFYTNSRMCVRYQYVTTVGRKDPNTDKGFVAEMRKLVADWEQQDEAREKLEAKLQAAINGCSTLKQARERMPEFEKYLPKERDGKINRSMPAIANIVADLAAAGWPKGQPLKAA